MFFIASTGEQIFGPGGKRMHSLIVLGRYYYQASEQNTVIFPLAFSTTDQNDFHKDLNCQDI